MKDFLRVVVYGGLFAIPFLTLYVANDYFFPYITGKNFAFRILVEVVFIAWTVLCFLDAKYRPKFSWVLGSFILFLIVMFFANLFGQHPQTSFWSNFERMEGYVTLVHLFLYVLVLGSVFQTKQQWNWYLHTTLVAALITAMYGLAQDSGKIEGFEPGRRLESYFGNAAYLSIYMLFHIFITFWLLVESKVAIRRAGYVLLAILFTYILLESGTRGTVLGLMSGIGVMATYIILFGSKYKEFRRYAIGVFVLLIIGTGALLLGKDTDFVKSNGNLTRIANIDLGEDLKVRGTIWSMAWEGVKDRPILGWGQGNFNYIFNEKYDPFLYNQEQWFDRAHNIIMDWLVAGGFLGLFTYLGIFVASIYYLIIVPLIYKDDESFTVLEQGVLLGILAGYFIHNLVVFDNIVSYMFFGLILALIHSRVGKVIPKLQAIKVDQTLVHQFVAPVAIVFLFFVFYLVQAPNIGAAKDIIDSYQTKIPSERLSAFVHASERNSFAQQEIVEQVAQQAMSTIRTEGVDPAFKQEFVTLAEDELRKLAEDKPNDARVEVFIGSFYRSIGKLDEAAVHMDTARKLSPRKQSIILQQAIIAYSQNNLEKARDLFGEAYKLDERNNEAALYYSSLLLATGDVNGAQALIKDQATLEYFAMNDFYLTSAVNASNTKLLIDLYKVRTEKKPETAQTWSSLAFLYSQAGDIENAVATLRTAAVKIPSFSKLANCIADNIAKKKTNPEDGC